MYMAVLESKREFKKALPVLLIPAEIAMSPSAPRNDKSPSLVITDETNESRRNS
jgi:hypothetical protein